MEHELKRSLAPKYKLATIEHTPEGARYTCVECPTSYDNKEQLELHLCSHFREYRFLCGICGTGLKRREHLERHTLGHQGVRPHVCPECGKGFKRKEHLNIHLSIHSGSKSHLCPICQRSFYRKDHLQKHMQTHTKIFMADMEFVDVKQEDESVDSIECEVSMEVDEENQSIEQWPPKDPMRPFECCLCHKTYKRKDHLKLHSMTHLAKDFSCEECGKGHIQRHVLAKLMVLEKSMRQEFEKGFHKEEQLLSHKCIRSKYQPDEVLMDSSVDPVANVQAIFDHTEIDIMPLEESSLLVPRVNYSASSRVRDNTEERRHECNVCHRKFKRKQHLKVHANVHAKQSPTIWCSLCSEGFINNSQFERHRCEQDGIGSEEEPARTDAKKENSQLHFGDYGLKILPPSPQEYDPIPIQDEGHIPTPQKVYVCKYCNKPFKRKDHYKIHLHIHTGIKSFFCPDCGKGFYRKDHLQKHIQVHSKNKPTPMRPIPVVKPKADSNPRPKKALPDLFPINMLNKEIKPEITITAPSNSKLRVPLQMKVPYQVVMCTASGERRAVTVSPATDVLVS